MSIVDAFLLQTCTITQCTNSDAWDGTQTETLAENIPCRFTREQKSVKLPDGTVTIATGKLMLSGETIVNIGDRVAVDNGNFSVIQFRETRDIDGSIAMITVYLS